MGISYKVRRCSTWRVTYSLTSGIYDLFWNDIKLEWSPPDSYRWTFSISIVRKFNIVIAEEFLA